MFDTRKAPLSRLSTSVGNMHMSDAADIVNTRRNFASLGRFDGDTELTSIDRGLDRTIRQFQSDKGLKVDGVMMPGGETERAMQRDLTYVDVEFPGYGEVKPLRLSDSVGNNRANEVGDVKSVQSYLGRLGIASEAKRFEPSGIIDRETVAGIETFQRQHDLRLDGFMNPGGETEQAMNHVVRTAADSGDGEGDGEEGGRQEKDPPSSNPGDKPPPKPDKKPEPPKGGDDEKKPPKPDEKPKPPKGERDCSDLEVAVGNAEAVLEQAQDALDKKGTEIEAEKEELEARVSEMQQELDKILAAQDATNKSVGGIATVVGSAAGGVFGFRTGKISGIQPGMITGGRIGGEVGQAITQALDGEIIAKQSAIAEVQSQINALKERLQELEAAVNEAQALLFEAHGALEACQMSEDN